MDLNSVITNAQHESLVKNEQSSAAFISYRKSLTETQSLLQFLPEKLSENVMVPLGPKAMMRGKIVHTNEFLVGLGDNYLVKRTAKQAWEICERKINNCDSMLDLIEKERKLLLNQVNFPGENDAFGSDERPEILEHVTEEEDKAWREQHIQREKDYRERLAAARNKEKKNIESEEDIWNRLDELELEEELEDELYRIHQQGGVEGGTNSDSSSGDESTAQEVEKIGDTKPESENTPRRRSVVFESEEFEEVSSVCPDPLVLNFKHSDEEPVESSFIETKAITSPSDIYKQYLCEITSVQPQSILRVRKNPNQEKELDSIKQLANEDEVPVQKVVSTGIVIPSVVERNVADPLFMEHLEQDGPPRRISKFKVSRLKQKMQS